MPEDTATRAQVSTTDMSSREQIKHPDENITFQKKNRQNSHKEMDVPFSNKIVKISQVRTVFQSKEDYSAESLDVS